MSEVKFSGVGVVAMNGSIGNTTFARNFYGTYAKTRLGAPPVTFWRTFWQSQITAISSVWAVGISEADKLTWYKKPLKRKDSMADTNTIIGFDLFMSVNLNLFLVGAFPTATRPPVLPPNYLKSCPNAYADATTIEVDVLVNGSPRFAIYATGNLPAGRISNNQIYTYICTKTSPSGTIDFSAEYLARMPAPIFSRKIFIKVMVINHISGQRGVPQYASCIVA